jgi:HlyD family secretion protein
MKKIIIGALVAVAMVAVVVVSVQKAGRRGTKVYEEEARQVESLITTVKASGEIQPRVYVNISSQVMGEIIDLRVEEGDQVRRGDILVQLDPEQYRSSVERLEANLRLARINLEQERTSLATYESILKRQQALSKEAIVSAESLEAAQLQYDRSRHQVRALEEQIRQADADLTKARDELEKTTLKAPMDGLVTRVNAKLGEQVIIGTMNNPGTVILVLSDMSELLAEVKVDETEVAQVAPGDTATVSVDALEDRRFDGVVAEIAHSAIKDRDVSRFIVKVSLSDKPSGEEQARTEVPLPASSKIPGGLAALRPGMSAHASIKVARRDKVLVVPLQAVITRKRSEVEAMLKGEEEKTPDSGPIAAEGAPSAEGTGAGETGNPPAQDEEIEMVFVDRDGKAVIEKVRTGLSDEFNVEIVDGAIQPGDKVVIGPYRTVKKLKHQEAIVRAEKDEDLKEED